MDSLIGQKAKVRGELTTQGSININGEFEGNLRAEGEVIISGGGKITGEVFGGNVVVSGLVHGNITAAQILEITRSGRVHGDLTGGRIIIEEGSSYHGKVKVNPVVTEGEEADTTSDSGGYESELNSEESDSAPTFLR
jgi:cytoskeletal protein CcmA (bactofilin family)